MKAALRVHLFLSIVTLAEKDGQPGVVFRWLEVEGPIYENWPPPGHQLLFGNLPMTNRGAGGNSTASASRRAGETNRFGERRFMPPLGVSVVSAQPMRDAERLLHHFIRQTYRRPTSNEELHRFLPVVERAL